MESAKGKWAKELSSVLWAYKTTLGGPQMKLPSMTFGIEAVIPVEIGLSSMKAASFSPSINDAVMTEQLDS